MVDVELSVIVPCHNVAETLGAQLDALAAQRWSGAWNVIVVDNGSTDRTTQIAASSRLGDRLRVVPATEGQSVAYARNAGVRATSARGVAFCDGDDIVRPGWVAAMGEALRSQSLVTGPIDTSVINDPWLHGARPGDSAAGLPMFGEIPFARGANMGVSRELWERLDGFDETFHGLEDIEFSLRAASTGSSVSFAPDASIDYRYRTGLRALWRQGWFYGRGRRELARRARILGLAAPSVLGGMKSWLWLVARLPQVRTRTGRYAWIWVLANRLGSLAGFVTAPQPFAVPEMASRR